MMRLFPYQITNSEYLEDFELNGIPVKAVTLHNSDFCQQNAANQNTNTWVWLPQNEFSLN
jgi:hypothetical protein